MAISKIVIFIGLLAAACSGPGTPPGPADSDIDATFHAPVSGLVRTAGDGLAGALVEIIGSRVRTMSDSGGAFTLDNAPGPFLNLRVSFSGSFFSSIVRVNVPMEGATGVLVELIRVGEVQGTMVELGRTYDNTKGMVAVRFANHTGGEGASISAASDNAYVFDGAGLPQEQNSLIAAGDGDIFFSNASPGSTTATVTACSLDFETFSFLVEERTTTWMTASCP